MMWTNYYTIAWIMVYYKEHSLAIHDCNIYSSLDMLLPSHCLRRMSNGSKRSSNLLVKDSKSSKYSWIFHTFFLNLEFKLTGQTGTYQRNIYSDKSTHDVRILRQFSPKMKKVINRVRTTKLRKIKPFSFFDICGDMISKKTINKEDEKMDKEQSGTTGKSPGSKTVSDSLNYYDNIVVIKDPLNPPNNEHDADSLEIEKDPDSVLDENVDAHFSKDETNTVDYDDKNIYESEPDSESKKNKRLFKKFNNRHANEPNMKNIKYYKHLAKLGSYSL